MSQRHHANVAGEYLVMAATLLHIKSRMLLPPDPSEVSEAPDLRAELVHQLVEHQRFKQAAETLKISLKTLYNRLNEYKAV